MIHSCEQTFEAVWSDGTDAGVVCGQCAEEMRENGDVEEGKNE